MKNLTATICLTIAVLFVATGCSTLTNQKNKSFVEGILKTDKPYHVVYMCRPNQLYMIGQSQGVYINTEPAFDLWMGNQYEIKLPKNYRSMQLMIPFQNPLEEILPTLSERNKLVFKVPENEDISFYIITTKRMDNIIHVIIVSHFGGNLKSKYTVYRVNKEKFNSLCGKEKITRYHHRTLLKN